MANKTKRVSFRIDKTFKQRIKQAARRERVREADFNRRLFDWAVEEYFRIGKLSALLKLSVPIRKGKETK